MSTRLAPLYDAVSTAYYPELTQKMAMKIGYEYESQRLLPIHFEKLAEEAGFGKALLKARLIELAVLIPDALGQMNRDHHLARDLGAVIAQRCHVILDRFR